MILLMYIFLHIYSALLNYNTLQYASWDISDWLINYQGGFVRRGLIGQMLFGIYSWHPFDVRIAIAAIYSISSLLILVLCLWIFKKEGWSPLILFTGCCFSYTLFSMFGRRDFIILLFSYFIFVSYRNYQQTNKWKSLVTFETLTILAILIHEASFFFVVPILLVYDFSHKLKAKGTWSSILSSLKLFLPILAVTALSGIFKGDAGSATAIWNSWSELFETYPDGTSHPMGLGVKAIGWSATGTFLNTLKWTFMGVDGQQTYWKIPLTLLLFVSVYYLATRVDACHLSKDDGRRKVDSIRLSNIVLFQFVILLPFYSFLSCDLGRTLAYWVLSSLFFYHVFPDFNICFHNTITKLSRNLQGGGYRITNC